MIEPVPTSGFQEREHTADWALDVWAPDLPGLLKTSAQGMYALMGAQAGEGLRQEREISLAYPDEESLLVGFLSEVLYALESEGLFFEEMDLRIADGQLTGRLRGLPVREVSKEIKAVTYHKLAVEQINGRYQTTIVFDV